MTIMKLAFVINELNVIICRIYNAKSYKNEEWFKLVKIKHSIRETIVDMQIRRSSLILTKA